MDLLGLGVDDLDALRRVGPEWAAGFLPIEEEGLASGLFQRSGLKQNAWVGEKNALVIRWVSF